MLDADAISITNGKISWLGNTDATRGNTVNCSGLTALPGLIDAHVHMELNPDNAKPPESTDESVAPLMAERAVQMAAAGITTARDLGGGAWFELALRNSIAAGESIGPRLVCSGQPITCPRGHCHFWGGEADTIDEAKSVLARQMEHDVALCCIM